MSSKRQYSRVNLWLVIGVAILIVLLLVWLTYAMFLGDTDVAALVVPQPSIVDMFL